MSPIRVPNSIASRAIGITKRIETNSLGSSVSSSRTKIARISAVAAISIEARRSRRRMPRDLRSAMLATCHRAPLQRGSAVIGLI